MGATAAAASPAKARYTGKQHKWGISPNTRINGKIISLFSTIFLLALTCHINEQPGTLASYTWLNENYTPFQINAWWSFGITSGVYWVGGLIYMMMDMFEPVRSRLESWKLQPETRVTWKDYRKVCLIVARNQLVVALPLTMAMGHFRPLATTAPLPTRWETIGTFVFCLAFEEVGFFYVHRMFHSPRFYKSVHKLHHTYTAPVALGSTYCTVVEHFFSNLLPIILGILMLRSHVSSMWMFFCSLELATLQTHSGYNFPGSFNALQHDWHHYSYTENYGPLGILDDVHGSNKVFREWLSELEVRDGVRDVLKVAREELAGRESRGETAEKGKML